MVDRSRIVGPAIIGAGHRGQRLLRRARSPRSRRTARSTTARSSTRSCCADSSISGVRRIEASLIGRDVEVTPAPRRPRPTGWCSATTARCRSAHEDPGHRRSRLHRLALRPHAAAAPIPTTAGAQVTVLDKLTYAGNPANLDPVRDAPRLSVRARRHLRRRAGRPTSMAGHDAVVHFAAESHVDRSIASAAEFVRTNVARHADAARRRARGTGSATFVHVSTDEVYGSIEEGSWPETHPLEPNSPYSASKAGSDLIALAYHRTHGLDVWVTRCSNNYGPYQFPEKVIPLFVTNLLDGKKVPLYGDGAQRPRLAARRRPLPRASSWSLDARAGPARSTTSAAAPS